MISQRNEYWFNFYDFSINSSVMQRFECISHIIIHYIFSPIIVFTSTYSTEFYTQRNSLLSIQISLVCPIHNLLSFWYYLCMFCIRLVVLCQYAYIYRRKKTYLLQPPLYASHHIYHKQIWNHPLKCLVRGLFIKSHFLSSCAS